MFYWTDHFGNTQDEKENNLEISLWTGGFHKACAILTSMKQI